MPKTIKLRPGSIKYLQNYVASKLKQRNFDDESLQERLLLLVEEIGELVNACRKISGMKVDSQRTISRKVGEELTDVLNLTFAVGIELGIDMEKEFVKKEKIVDRRFYKRSKNKVK